MRVKELREVLSKLDGEMNVVISSDEEGNYYNIASTVNTEGIFVNSDECYDAKWSADECCLEEDEWESMKNIDSYKCLIIYP